VPELRRVLAATDGSDHGLNAVVTGAACARRLGVSLEIVSVVETLTFPFGVEFADYHDAYSEELRRKVATQADAADASDAPVHQRSGLAAPLITELADELEPCLIVVGAHPRPAVARFLVGSTAERVMRMAHCPVLVATAARREPFQRVLVAIDLSRQSLRVLEIAAAIVQANGAQLRALYVHDQPAPMLLEAALFDEKESRDHARGEFSRTVARVALPSELMVSRSIREGHAGHEILHEAQDWDADLVVMGSHGFGFFNRLLLGSTSVYMLRHGHRATLVVPREKGG
jgi:nucleotide-binding universal stress UspA family protein